MGGVCSRRWDYAEVPWHVMTRAKVMTVYRSKGSDTWTCPVCEAIWTRTWDVRRGFTAGSLASSTSSSTEIVDVDKDTPRKNDTEKISMPTATTEIDDATTTPRKGQKLLQVWEVTSGSCTHSSKQNYHECECGALWVRE